MKFDREVKGVIVVLSYRSIGARLAEVVLQYFRFSRAFPVCKTGSCLGAKENTLITSSICSKPER